MAKVAHAVDNTELAELLGEPAPPATAGNDSRVRLVALLSDLPVRHQRFIAAVLAGQDGRSSAIAAGFSAHSAASRAWKLLHENEAVKSVLALCREITAEGAVYTLERSMSELDDAVQFARDNRQANALVKAIELRARLNGLLTEKIDLKVEAGPSLRDALMLARERLDRRLGHDAIEGEFSEVES